MISTLDKFKAQRLKLVAPNRGVDGGDGIGGTIPAKYISPVVLVHGR